MNGHANLGGLYRVCLHAIERVERAFFGHGCPPLLLLFDKEAAVLHLANFLALQFAFELSYFPIALVRLPGLLLLVLRLLLQKLCILVRGQFHWLVLLFHAVLLRLVKILAAHAGVHAAAVSALTPRMCKRARPALEIAEGVMGRVAWDDYSNSKYMEMKGARKPAGRGATTKKTTARKLLMGGSLTDWTLQTPLQYFKDVDTKWRMDTELVWLSPDGDLSKTFVITLGT